MTEAKTTCQACGVAILVTTAQATGGYCRSGRCKENRRSQIRRDEQRAIVERLMQSGELRTCPQCGTFVRSSRLEKHTGEKCEMRRRPHPYASVLPCVPLPQWLERLVGTESLPPSIPLADVLRESCFYPSSGLDSSPVLLANGCVHSFVYVDYSTSRDDFLRALSSPGFSPYEPLLHRDVERHELVPGSWAPESPRWFDNLGFDGRQRLMEAQQRCRPFGHWSIWRRKAKRGEHVGPRLFSFLFLGGEALACYEGLYSRNGMTPKVMAMIQPGHACGDNWTNFYDPNAPLWRAVSAGAALPDYLLIGSYGRRCSEACPFDGYALLHTTTTHDREWRTIDVFTRERVT